MGWTRTFVRRERGGIVLWTLVALILVAGAYYGYKAFVFYRANVAPAVAEVAKVAGAGWPSSATTAARCRTSLVR